MKKNIDIRPILPIETHVVRHPVLRNGRPKRDCVFDDDEKESSLHFGAFRGGELIGVSSAYLRPHDFLSGKNSFQIRGVAILPMAQGQGIGRALMKTTEGKLIDKGCDLIWLNAREKAVPFYQRLNYLPFGEPFPIEKIGIHCCLYKTFDHA